MAIKNKNGQPRPQIRSSYSKKKNVSVNLIWQRGILLNFGFKKVITTYFYVQGFHAIPSVIFKFLFLLRRAQGFQHD